jgi:hypothetical protein
MNRALTCPDQPGDTADTGVFDLATLPLEYVHELRLSISLGERRSCPRGLFSSLSVAVRVGFLRGFPAGAFVSTIVACGGRGCSCAGLSTFSATIGLVSCVD